MQLSVELKVQKGVTDFFIDLLRDIPQICGHFGTVAV
jgi:hypothetical protein